MALTGCGGGQDRVTLRIASWADQIEQAIEAQNLAAFEQRHPGVRVANDAISTQAEYREQILTSIAAGAPPDVFLLDNIDVPAFAARDVLLDLTPFARRVGLDPGGFDSLARSIFTVDGKLLAFPKGFTPMVVAYNRRLFDLAGVAYPTADWTWDDFLSAAKALTRDTDGDGRVDQWGIVFDRRVFLWISWIWSGGGDVLCPDGRHASGCLDSPATVRAFRWYLDWVQRDSIVPRVFTLRRSLGDQFRLFNSGKVAMLTTGHFWVPQLRPYAEEGRISMGFAPIPHRVGSPASTVVFASGWAVPSEVPRRRLAVQLASFMADTQARRVRASRGLEIPGIDAVAQELAEADTSGWEAVFHQAMKSARAPWGVRVRGWREVENRLPQAIDEVLLESRDLESALHAAALEIDGILAETER